MVTEIKEGYGTQSCIVELNVSEMNSIAKLFDRAVRVRKSHEASSKKKEYFTLEDINCVIRVCGSLTKQWPTDVKNDIEGYSIDEVLQEKEKNSPSTNI